MSEENVIDRAMRAIAVISSALATISLALLVVLFLALIALRPFGVVIPSAEQFASIALAGTFVLGLAYALAEGEHIEIRVAVDRMPPRIRFLLAVAAMILSLVIVAVLCWGVGRLWLGAFQRSTAMLGTLPIPKSIPLAVVLAGLVLFELALVLKFVRLFVGDAASREDRHGR